jgi:hypothetical protein
MSHDGDDDSVEEERARRFLAVLDVLNETRGWSGRNSTAVSSSMDAYHVTVAIRRSVNRGNSKSAVKGNAKTNGDFVLTVK